MRIVLIATFLAFLSSAYGQNTEADTSKKKWIPNPKTASLLSAVVPGAGQVYNRSYWKLPLVYAGLGGGIYFYTISQNEFNLYKQSYRANYGAQDVEDPLADQGTLAASYLEQQMEIYRKRSEYGIIAIAGVYVIQILEAAVDAHLTTFDVSEDLSIKVSPGVVQHPYGQMAGLSVKLNIK